MTIISSFIENVYRQFTRFWNGDKKQDLTLPTAFEEGQKTSEATTSEDTDTSRPKRRRNRQNRRRRPKAHPQESPVMALVQAEPWDPSLFDVSPAEGKTRFHDLDLPEEVMHAIFDTGFQYCTPIQAAILPKALTGIDCAGRAQTGTGKTAAFLITAITQLLRSSPAEGRKNGTPRVLILAPTRELAIQIQSEAQVLSKYTTINTVAVFGGMDYEKQKRLLSDRPVDIVVATPGRLLDFKQQGDVSLNKIEILVIDEADRMLDMGFIPDVQRIIHSTPPKANRTTMLFSATLTPEITRFATQWTREPFVVEIEPEQVTVDSVEQLIYITTMEEKFPLLYNMITQQNLERVIVFGNRRDQTRRLVDKLTSHRISCALLSGEVDQKKRITTLENFRAGKIRVLVATDVAARGIHIDGVSHVINFNLPHDPEDYVHRIGRTGRAGASGISVSFACEEDSFYIPGIEKYIGRELSCVYPDDAWLASPPPPEKNIPHTPAPPRSRRPGSSSAQRPHRSRPPRDRKAS